MYGSCHHHQLSVNVYILMHRRYHEIQMLLQDCVSAESFTLLIKKPHDF